MQTSYTTQLSKFVTKKYSTKCYYSTSDHGYIFYGPVDSVDKSCWSFELGVNRSVAISVKKLGNFILSFRKFVGYDDNSYILGIIKRAITQDKEEDEDEDEDDLEEDDKVLIKTTKANSISIARKVLDAMGCELCSQSELEEIIDEDLIKQGESDSQNLF